MYRGVGYGEEITRLTRAEQIVTQSIAQGKSKNIPGTCMATAESVLQAIVRAKGMADKDNRTIYHDTIPDFSTLTPVSPVAMVKPAGMQVCVYAYVYMYVCICVYV
jgi:hypothetical protein